MNHNSHEQAYEIVKVGCAEIGQKLHELGVDTSRLTFNITNGSVDVMEESTFHYIQKPTGTGYISQGYTFNHINENVPERTSEESEDKDAQLKRCVNELVTNFETGLSCSNSAQTHIFGYMGCSSKYGGAVDHRQGKLLTWLINDSDNRIFGQDDDGIRPKFTLPELRNALARELCSVMNCSNEKSVWKLTDAIAFPPVLGEDCYVDRKVADNLCVKDPCGDWTYRFAVNTNVWCELFGEVFTLGSGSDE